ncbi:hypothetical protein [Bacillus infantis]|jgi:hypothetical protein|uniref:hypothetical protein n=1 Tax=Bacillus infantis TaxID=324767 RepID=UPI0021557A36|nr:hypothetical protein [Bacillus infantis]MCR6610981.1 hypothetical protein [Bacillus infantis]
MKKGIYFINEKLTAGDYEPESIHEIQKKAAQDYMKINRISSVRLNRWQLNDHYENLHALYYDLKEGKMMLDCLVCFNEQSASDFAAAYPARWLLLKSFFHEICFSEEKALPAAE